ncbi:DEAD/DEAH box helicase [Microvirga sp. BSC39]|uniref:DEAD/DEAH box helicase n=1 Tax=Microvirga sp. BSC39 TaxID=1549810 RepID=UPI0004E8E9B8|nr:DEAD/DEAH box helicase [Microvirga sp. BSC39]KFG69398.1 hypothetical protein JH26_11305 [Microvirga sp. BSC39]
MSSIAWIEEALGEDRLSWSTAEVGRDLLAQALQANPEQHDDPDLVFVAETLELAIFDLLDDTDRIADLRRTAGRAFDILRVIAVPPEASQARQHLLRAGCLGILADRGPDVARYLREKTIPEVQTDEEDWGKRVRSITTHLWLCLIRKDGWQDLDRVQELVVGMRQQQQIYETNFLEQSGEHARAAAWELVALYHLSKAAELLAVYTSQGSVQGSFDIREQLQSQFDRSRLACERAELAELFSLTRLLARAAIQLVENSIWTVTRAVNSRVTRFVRSLTDRERLRPVFEMLPPQRVALREQGLLGSGYRSVVVSLPTSSGKTFIAQFRILQALNQFDQERGWVAYIAPTRALVNQVCARLRRDFEPLGIGVERVSPALEVDSAEFAILTDQDPTKAFRVLVGTPEKLDLLLRGGWEAKIGRPLTLVVVDEAHNLGQGERGLRLELLLATINRECRNSQFLLLTPFVPNAAEIARWLSPDSNRDVTAQFDWKPNDRAIVLAQPRRQPRRGDYSIELKTVHTTRNTIDVPGAFTVQSGRALNMTWGQVRLSQSKVAAATADALQSRGSVIVVANNVPRTWTIARQLRSGKTPTHATSPDVALVRRFVEDELGSDFELLECLDYGIGVHHSGLSEDVRSLMEWLVENERLPMLVATTTIAQGVNFPVSAVVLAGHQYPYGEDMPPQDFWNLAGRAGRADQASTGIVALAATDDQRAAILESYVRRNVADLNSSLIQMVRDVLRNFGQIELNQLFYKKEWSNFLQYLAHTYRQIDDHDQFANQVEQVLRGSLGFQKLRSEDLRSANLLISAVQRYASVIRGKPLALVDSTGFSWESVSIAMRRISEERLTEDLWDADRLFNPNDGGLRKAMGVLLEVPELRENLESATGGRGRDGDLLARVVKDWVHGESIAHIAQEYFFPDDPQANKTDAITECCRNVYGKLIQTAAWGLSALQSLTLGDRFEGMSDDEQKRIRNLPAYVYYGVDSDAAVGLRLLGVPRSAAQPLAAVLGADAEGRPQDVRTRLQSPDDGIWRQAFGARAQDYKRIWNILEGRDR